MMKISIFFMPFFFFLQNDVEENFTHTLVTTKRRKNRARRNYDKRKSHKSKKNVMKPYVCESFVLETCGLTLSFQTGGGQLIRYQQDYITFFVAVTLNRVTNAATRVCKF